MMPAVLLKKMVMGNFDKGMVDNDIADSIDFMVESVSWFKQYLLDQPNTCTTGVQYYHGLLIKVSC